jgi:hypothetical protein
MNDSQDRKMDKIDREEAFFTESAADFPASSRGGQLTALINAEKAKILQFDAAQTSGFDDKRQAQEIYENRRDELVDLLETFVLAAAIVDDDFEGTAAKFKMPHPRSDQKLIAKAASFYADSADIEAELTAELPANARDRLHNLSISFQQAALANDTAQQSHAGASSGMADSFRKIMDLSRRRDKSVKLKYRDNAAKLGAWTVASHLERAPQKKKNDDSPPKAEELKTEK